MREGRDAISPFQIRSKNGKVRRHSASELCSVDPETEGIRAPRWDVTPVDGRHAGRRSSRNDIWKELVQVFPHSFKIDAHLPKAVAAPVQPRVVRLTPLPSTKSRSSF